MFCLSLKMVRQLIKLTSSNRAKKDDSCESFFLYIIFTDVNHDQADYGGSHKQSKLQHR